MCGIVGYVGGRNAVPVLVEGLSRLEYRGYDSAGIAVLAPAARRCSARSAGSVTWRPRCPGGCRARSASGTPGGPRTARRPRRTPTRRPARTGGSRVVHNGIIDNAAVLRERLAAQGVTFTSETDTEIIAHLVARSEAGTLEEAVLEALSRITGTYAILVMDQRHPDRSWSRATAPRSSWASATGRCSWPVTCRRWCGTPRRWFTWTTASWPR